MKSRGSRTTYWLISISLSLLILLTITSSIQWSISYAQAQAERADLSIESLELFIENTPITVLPSAEKTVTIRAVVKNLGPGDALNFVVHMKFKRVEEEEFRGDELCNFVGGTTRCTVSKLVANQSIVAIGFLDTSRLKDEGPGQYIIGVQIELDPQTVVDPNPGNNVKEIPLSIGLTLPEFHPISVSFTPSSPVLPGTKVTVKAQIENTGKPPQENSQLVVIFQHCPSTSNCTEDKFSSNGFPDADGPGPDPAGVVRILLDSSVQKLLPQIETTLDTTGFNSQSYMIRVRTEYKDAAGLPLSELDPNNNEIRVILTVIARTTAICPVSGQMVLLGRGGQGLSKNADGNMVKTIPVLYATVTTSPGSIAQNTSLHAWTQEMVERTPPGNSCLPIKDAPTLLPADGRNPRNASITSNAVADQRNQTNNLLYVGLSNGDLLVIDLNPPIDQNGTPTLNYGIFTITSPLAAPIISLAPGRSLAAGRREVFVGTQSLAPRPQGGQLYRLEFTKNAAGTIQRVEAELCHEVGGSVNAIAVLDLNVFYGTSEGKLYATSALNCRGLLQGFQGIPFSASITALETAQVSVDTRTEIRILVGLANGKLHILKEDGKDAINSRSPIPLGASAAITRIRTDELANVAGAAYVGTASGTIWKVTISDINARCLNTLSKRAINALAYEPVEQIIFTSSEKDENMYVLQGGNCDFFRPPDKKGPVSDKSNIVLDKSATFVSAIIRAFYAVGGGLAITEVNLSAIETE